ncbi:MAG: N-acetylmuramoyl-L-alanine amidase [Rhizobiaceae bacterium]|nr:N-acetylmuramoyl-L-alanine amidase [Rhizobiaceae bacterium]
MPEGLTQFTADSSLVELLSPSQNYSERVAGKALNMIVLHYTGMKTAEAALAWLCDDEAQVSCHYFVFEDGRIAQLVAEEKRAWHAGKSCWQGERDINSRSIGIEISNRGHEYGYVDFPQVQMDSVIELVGDIVKRRNIPAANILAHSDVAPMRKEDPGERFDWRQLHEAGLGIWVEPAAIVAGGEMRLGDKGRQVQQFKAGLEKLGFEISPDDKFDELTAACTRAFQRRYRQERVDGVGDVSTVDTLERLILIGNCP